ncbi:hypothetical protein [Listeria booriae]|uniref:hypothetical protein n=1 Tax=Listeria booriae TaxID=1552123 RepID=UPI00162AEDA2|nr:hypothetical protein [Listeria booriae]MBC1228627.1 hypothetical protein [Listeria booriae]
MSKNEASIALLKNKIDVTKYEEYRDVLQDLSNQALDMYTGNTNIPFEFSDLDEIHDFWLRARSDLDAILNMSRNNQNESVMYSDESWDQEDDKFKLHALSELARITYYNGENANAIIGGHEDDIENAFQHLVIDSSNRIQLATFPISQLQEEKDSAALHVLKMHLQRYEGLVPRVYDISLKPPEVPLLPEEEPIFLTLEQYSKGINFEHGLGHVNEFERMKRMDENTYKEIMEDMRAQSMQSILEKYDRYEILLRTTNNDMLDVYLGDSTKPLEKEVMDELKLTQEYIRDEINREVKLNGVNLQDLPVPESKLYKLQSLDALINNTLQNARGVNDFLLGNTKQEFYHSVIDEGKNIVDYTLSVDEILKAKNTPEIGVLRTQLEAYNGKFSNEYKPLSVKEYAEGFSSGLLKKTQEKEIDISETIEKKDEPAKTNEVGVEKLNIKETNLEDIMSNLDSYVDYLQTFNNRVIDVFTEEAEGLKLTHDEDDFLRTEIRPLIAEVRAEEDKVYELLELTTPDNPQKASLQEKFESFQKLDTILTNVEYNTVSARAFLHGMKDDDFKHSIIDENNQIVDCKLTRNAIRKAQGEPGLEVLRKDLQPYIGKYPQGENDDIDMSIETYSHGFTTAKEQNQKQSKELDQNSVGIVKMKLNDKGQGVATVQYGEITLNNIRVVDSNGIPNVYPPSVKGKDDKYYPVFELNDKPGYDGPKKMMEGALTRGFYELKHGVKPEITNEKIFNLDLEKMQTRAFTNATFENGNKSMNVAYGAVQVKNCIVGKAKDSGNTYVQTPSYKTQYKGADGKDVYRKHVSGSKPFTEKVIQAANQEQEQKKTVKQEVPAR